eukprot:g15005.t1
MMAADLGEIVMRHTENKDATQKELALQPFAQAYYAAVRNGICNAYLAASVVSSSWVCTSKTGRMGKVGKAVKLLSSVPVVGVLAGPMGTALKAGDGYVQARLLEKISSMAPDAVECCSLARKVGLRLTEVLPDEAASMIDQADEVHVQTTAGAHGTAGASGSSHGIGATPEGSREVEEEEEEEEGDEGDGEVGEDLFDYVVDEVSGYQPTDKGGRKLGKRHLCKLLKAVRRDCLEGVETTEKKVDILLRVILPEAKIGPNTTSSVPKNPFVKPPVAAPSHDGGLDRDAELAVLKAKLEALELDKADQQAEIKKLRGKVTTMEKQIPKNHAEPGYSVHDGQQLFKQKQQTATRDEFWQNVENSDRRTLSADDHQAETRNIQAHVHEVDSRVGFLEAEVAAMKEQLRGRKNGR